MTGLQGKMASALWPNVCGGKGVRCGISEGWGKPTAGEGELRRGPVRVHTRRQIQILNMSRGQRYRADRSV